MKTLILALAAAATLGLAAPAFANGARDVGTVKLQSQDFSSGHRHHWRHHRWHRHHYPHCQRVWRWGHWVTVCR